MPRLCPKRGTCGCLLSREEFLSVCVDGWERCPIYAKRKPQEWLVELGEELGLEPLARREAEDHE